jgi:hypothetical protein
MALTRKGLKDLGLTDEQIDAVMDAHKAVTSRLKSDDDVQTAIQEAIKALPKPRAQDLDEYKALKKEFEDFKYSNETKAALKGAKVKDKFLDDVLAKLKREGKIEEQLPKLKETYAEFFEADGQTPPALPKPVFSGLPQPNPQQAAKKEIPKFF